MHKWCCKKVFTITATNLVDEECVHIKRCKRPMEAWRTLCNIHETKNLSNIFLITCKFFTVRMNKGDDMFDHISKVKYLAHHPMCLEVLVKDKDVITIFLLVCCLCSSSLSPHWRHNRWRSSPWTSSPHGLCTRFRRGRRRNRKETMRRWCCANLKCSTTIKNTPTTQGGSTAVN